MGNSQDRRCAPGNFAYEHHRNTIRHHDGKGLPGGNHGIGRRGGFHAEAIGVFGYELHVISVDLVHVLEVPAAEPRCCFQPRPASLDIPRIVRHVQCKVARIYIREGDRNSRAHFLPPPKHC